MRLRNNQTLGDAPLIHRVRVVDQAMGNAKYDLAMVDG